MNQLGLKGVDYVEVYAGNAIHAAHYYRAVFGFKPVGYAGPETGVRDRVSFVLVQGEIRLVVTSAIDSDSPIADHLNLHGEGVKDIAFLVDDAEGAFNWAVKHSGRALAEPASVEDANGRFVKAAITTFGDTVHSFIERKDYSGTFAPGYTELRDPARAESVRLAAIDHFAVAVESGTLPHWVDYYKDVLDLDLTQQEDISSDYSGMNTRVVRNDSGAAIFVFVEPVSGSRKSVIEEYLTYHRGAGVHHIALQSEDITGTVRSLRSNGATFASTPAAYYDTLRERVGPISESISELREQSILVDRDEWGYLMQIFVKPAQPRPTFFFEIIQRMSARGFGNGNIKALYEAIERDQVRRGNN